MKHIMLALVFVFGLSTISFAQNQACWVDSASVSPGSSGHQDLQVTWTPIRISGWANVENWDLFVDHHIHLEIWLETETSNGTWNQSEPKSVAVCFVPNWSTEFLTVRSSQISAHGPNDCETRHRVRMHVLEMDTGVEGGRLIHDEIGLPWTWYIDEGEPDEEDEEPDEDLEDEEPVE